MRVTSPRGFQRAQVRLKIQGRTFGNALAGFVGLYRGIEHGDVSSGGAAIVQQSTVLGALAVAAVLVRPELGFGLEALAPLLFADLAVVEIAALRRALRGLVPLRQPVAERIAEPGRLRAQRPAGRAPPRSPWRAPCIPAWAARAAACRPSWSRPSAASSPLRCRARAWARGPGRGAAAVCTSSTGFMR